MINLYEKGAYLVNGTELVDEDNTEKLAQLTGSALSKEEARQNTIAISESSAITIHPETWTS